MSFDRMNGPLKVNGKVKEITSLANPIIKDLRALSMKKVRDREKVFLAEGLKLIIDALDLGWKIKTLVFSKRGLGNALVEKNAARTVAAGGLVLETSDKVMESITRRDNPQMVVGVFEQQILPFSSLKPKKEKIYLALDRIRDPGNLGTIIRTADAVGVSGIFLIGDTTDPFSLETVRATMGSIFAVPLFKGDENAFLEWRKHFSGMVVGTHLKGSVDYRTINYLEKGSTMLVMGNEQQGLTSALADCCDRLARIPQAGRADSLNLAIATAVMLYEMQRDVLVLDAREIY